MVPGMAMNMMIGKIPTQQNRQQMQWSMQQHMQHHIPLPILLSLINSPVPNCTNGVQQDCERRAMSSRQQPAKRPRTDQPEACPAQDQPPGRNQLLLKSPELQSRLGKRYCDESELLPLLLLHGLVGRVDD